MRGENNMSFSLSPPDKRKLIVSSLQTKRMLLSQEDFNSLADYLLFKRFLKKVDRVYEREEYIIAGITTSIPIREWNRTTEKRLLDRYIIIGEDENGKIVCFYSDRYIDNGIAFWFDEDVSHLGDVEIKDLGFERRYRVQGDIVLVVSNVNDLTRGYLNSILRASALTIDSILMTEIYRRISDILADLGITSAIIDNHLVIEGCPRNIRLDKLMNYIYKNLILSDIFKDYNVRLESGYGSDWYLRFSSNENNNVFTLVIWFDTMRRRERELHVRVNYSTMLSQDAAVMIFFENIIQETKLLDSVEEIEIEERLGRHIINIENALPRRLSVDYEFPLSRRRYNILLTSAEYLTSGTKIKLYHPQHGNKTVKVPQSSFRFDHVLDPYRTTAIKNNLLLHYYFT
ncbi:MAG: hypothetical protein QXH44_10105 [Pyrobaculum sp.]